MRNLSLLLPLLAAQRAHAWGAAGHQVTAAVAERLLTPGAAAGLATDLEAFSTFYPSQSTLITSSTWADTIKSSNSAFNEWHYVDTPFSPSGASVDVCDELQNVVWAMGQCVHVLNNGKADVGNRALMARLLVHFVGDIHQPLHATALFTDTFPGGDAGGNSIKLSPPAPVGDYTSSNLHSYWDSGTANSGLEDIKSGDLEAIRLMAELLLDDEAAQIAATPLSSASAFTDALKAWAQESFLFASNSTYAPALLDALGSGKTVDTSAGWWAGYGADNSVLVRDRLRLGGARLAQVLNSIYG